MNDVLMAEAVDVDVTDVLAYELLATQSAKSNGGQGAKPDMGSLLAMEALDAGDMGDILPLAMAEMNGTPRQQGAPILSNLFFFFKFSSTPIWESIKF